MWRRRISVVAITLSSSLAGLGAIAATTNSATAAPSNAIAGPQGSKHFGEKVTVLSNGNFVVVDTGWAPGGMTDVGAVYLYDGQTNQLISTLRGARSGDLVGDGGIVEVGTSDFVVISRSWANQAAARAGAYTFVDGSAGLNATVAPANSLVGGQEDDGVAASVTPLANGNYVVVTEGWDDGTTPDIGAATWSSATSPARGPISPTVSLVGSSQGDLVGSAVVALTNGNYVVAAARWDSARPDVGAVTWADGAQGIRGRMVAANSLIGSKLFDNVGQQVTALANGNYVVASPGWDNATQVDTGAVTWRPGDIASPGVVGVDNSLIGNNPGDATGNVTPLTNGNYVVASPHWHVPVAGGVLADGGAVTWANGTMTTTGTANTGNSLFGVHANDSFLQTVTPLTDGDYVVSNPFFDFLNRGDAGAVTWRPGDRAIGEQMLLTNSLIGGSVGAAVGQRVVALPGGNYVVGSTHISNGANVNAGAITWGNGVSGTKGELSAANSMLGVAANEALGSGLTALTNGNFVVGTENHPVNGTVGAGSATWRANGPVNGTLGNTEGILGSTTNDHVGRFVLALPQGNYLVLTQFWDNTAAADAGAVTFATGAAATNGPVGVSNSLVGSRPNDQVGSGSAVQFADGRYVVLSPLWDNGAVVDAGAATVAPATGVFGVVSAANSVVGTGAGDGAGLTVGGFVGTDGVLHGRPTKAGSVLIGRPHTNEVIIVGGQPTDPTTTTTTTPGTKHSSEYVALDPARLADTRDGATTVDGMFSGGGIRNLGSTLELVVAGRGGVPADAKAAVLNVTAVDAAAPGFLTVFPCGATQPTASNLNFPTHDAVPNATIAAIGSGGKVCIFVSQPVHLVVDVNGAYPKNATYVPANPARVLDTREGFTTVDGLQQGAGRPALGSVTTLQITGRAGVPAAINSIALNITATQSQADGFVTVYPCDAPRPNASNLNIAPGRDVANLVITRTDANGAVCLFSSQSTHLVADVNGYSPTSSPYHPTVPARLLDTRPGFSTIDGQFAGTGVVALGTVTELQVAGRSEVPANATTVALAVTATEPAAAGFITVFPCGIARPLASSVNFTAGQTIPNTVIVSVGAGGKVCLFNSQPTHLIVDVNGYLAP